ncbi:MAG: heme biosynthesis HemY N-terminal domain-containing protein [Pseudomonadota bacterium]
MIRILFFLIFVVLAATLLTWLAGLTGLTVMRVGDLSISAPSSAFLGVALFAIFAIIITTLISSGLVRLPNKLRRKREERRRVKGMTALTRGLEAVAAGDAGDAQRHARMATKQLDEPGITRLLTAQAAQLAGDDETAQASFAAMLEAPETEFLGLRGLYLQALTAGDQKEALGYAERAFQLRPSAGWAYQSVYGLHLDRAAWGDAIEVLRLAKKHDHEEGQRLHRKEAALLTAQAYAAENAEDIETALKDAEAALKLSPGFAPAAVLAARLEGAAGKRSKAGRLLDDAWAISPHPAIAKTMADLYKDEKLEKRTARLKRLADKAPDADESILLKAEQDIALGAFEEAKTALEPLLTRTPRARTFAAMADAMEGLYGLDAAQLWLDRAAAAPLDPVPGAEGIFNITTDGWHRLIREFGEHGRMAPPPLEELRTQMSQAEIKLLTAPPPEPEPEPVPIEDLDDVESAEPIEEEKPLKEEETVATDTTSQDVLEDDEVKASDYEEATPPDEEEAKPKIQSEKDMASLRQGGL